jgi:hypothetical protein
LIETDLEDPDEHIFVILIETVLAMSGLLLLVLG